MPYGDTVSRFAVQRYRVRLLLARLSMGRPPMLHLVNLVLAVIGAWSVIYQAAKLLPGDDPALGLTLAGVAAGVLGAVLIWLQLAQRPQDLFRSAALTERRAEALRRSM